MAGKRYVPLFRVDITGVDGVVNLVNGQPQTVSTIEFVQTRIVDSAFGTPQGDGFVCDAATVYAGARVDAAFRAAEKNGDVYVEIDEDDYQRLLRATMTPRTGTGYNANVGASLIPFMRAIEDAKRELPTSDGVAP